MSWIEEISYSQSSGLLRKLYDRIKGPENYIDNVMSVHSLRPSSLAGHMTLYKNVLHHSELQVPKWILELFGVYVSILNSCDYCIEHHLAGLGRLIDDDGRTQELFNSLKSETYQDKLDSKLSAALDYVKKLSITPSLVDQDDLETLRKLSWTDGEILEINQVTAYFSYANRTVLGLGVELKGDQLGLSPSDSSNENNWGHQ